MTAKELLEAAQAEERYGVILQRLHASSSPTFFRDAALQRIRSVKNPLHEALLIRRGIDGVLWADMELETGYCERHLRRKYSKALAALDRVLKAHPL